jgi:hypothetical protein
MKGAVFRGGDGREVTAVQSRLDPGGDGDCTGALCAR